MRTRWAAGALAASAVTYSAWLLAPWLNPALDPLRAYASELAAADQPYWWLFRGGDLVAGSLALAAAVALRRRPPRLGWAAVALFGVFTIVDAGWLNMVCAPSIDQVCATAEARGSLPWRHQWHTLSSSLAALMPILGCAAFARHWRDWFGWTLTAALTVVGLITAWSSMSGGETGFSQRIQLLLIAAWLVWLALRTGRST